MGTWDRLAELPLRVESYALDGLLTQPRPEFVRRTTVVRLRGSGEEGLGEDISYDATSQLAQQERGPVLPLVGEHTLGGFSGLLVRLDLGISNFEAPHRRWGYESAALDLALRQAGLSLPAALGREPKPIRYVVS